MNGVVAYPSPTRRDDSGINTALLQSTVNVCILAIKCLCGKQLLLWFGEWGILDTVSGACSLAKRRKTVACSPRTVTLQFPRLRSGVNGSGQSVRICREVNVEMQS